MLRKLRRKAKGQSTAEYAILIALVVGAIISMQVYVQRAIKGRIRDAVTNYMMTQTANLGTTSQYEPYYLTTNFAVYRDSKDEAWLLANKQIGGIGVNQRLNVERTGFQEFSYNMTGSGI